MALRAHQLVAGLQVRSLLRTVGQRADPDLDISPLPLDLVPYAIRPAEDVIELGEGKIRMELFELCHHDVWLPCLGEIFRIRLRHVAVRFSIAWPKLDHAIGDIYF